MEGQARSNYMQTASDFPPELKAPCSVCIKLAVQLLSLEEEGPAEEQVAFSFELGAQAPRITEGIVRSAQGSRGREMARFFEFCVGREPGREGSVTATAMEGY